MRAEAKTYLPAIACAATLLGCYFLVRPYAEIGILDDWSYIKSAQVLAQTGHIVYNGWSNAMLGWQLYFGALLIRLFGFSFTVVRFATVIEAMATAFLLERTCERAGLNAWNATLATLTFVLSPVYFPLQFIFMTDVSGVLAIVACLYMCLRAVEAKSEGLAMTWICLAALVNAVGGTARQIAWLGLLVMVPSTLWLLRKSRRVLAAGCICWIIGVVFMMAAMRWFAAQPYTIPSSPSPGTHHWEVLRVFLNEELWSAGALALPMLPVLLMFAGSIRRLSRRKVAAFVAAYLVLMIAWGAVSYTGRMPWWRAPFFDDFSMTSSFDKLNDILVGCTGLSIAGKSLGFLLEGGMMMGVLGLAACAFTRSPECKTCEPTATSISWSRLGVLVGCFSVAYTGLLASIALWNKMFTGRYLLPLIAISLLVLSRLYQERVKARLPWASILLIVLFGSFSVAATHDEFASYRGYAAAVNEIRSSGVPATAILGPTEFLMWTQAEVTGYWNDPRIRIPAGAFTPLRPLTVNCEVASIEFLPYAFAVEPVYAVHLDGETCSGQLAFPPVMFRTWIAPHDHWLYDVKLAPPLSP